MELLSPDDLYRALTARVMGGERPVTFLVGSAVSLPDDTGKGVPGVSAMLDLVRDELRRVDKEAQVLDSTSYQEVFARLKNVISPEAPNRVIQRAVLMSRYGSPDAINFDSFWDFSQSAEYHRALDRYSQTSNDWHIPNPTKSLARLCSLYPRTFGNTVLTTNFDALLEIALRGLGTPYFSSALHADGSFGNVSGTGTHVVHLHGHWLGSDTLHTFGQLNHPRPQVRSSIRRLLEQTTVVVLGYGGWEDMFMSAVSDLGEDDNATPDIVWCFYSRDPGDVDLKQQHVLVPLGPLIARGRARLFSGIDVADLLPELVRRCQQRKLAEQRSIVLEHFRRAVWNDLFNLQRESPGDIAKALCELGGEFLTVRATFAAVKAAASRGTSLSEEVEGLFVDYRDHLLKHEIKVSDYQTLEARRRIAIDFCERDGSDIDRAALNAVLAADCYLVVGDFDGQTAATFCAKAWQIMWRVMDSDRYGFWLEVIRPILGSIEE